MAKHKKIKAAKNCAYCGIALEPGAVTVDHAAPIGLFDFRDRPKGLEVPSCLPCNGGVSDTDQVIALLSRIYPDGPSPEHVAELQELLKAVSNNAPDVLLEMEPYPAAAKHAKRRAGSQAAGILRIGGPLVTGHLEKFAARFGLATHFLTTGRPLSSTGAVISAIYSNMDVVDGRFPDAVVDELGSPQTLRAGAKHVGNQFAYAMLNSPDGTMSMGFASLRQSFAFFTFAADDVARLRVNGEHPAKLHRRDCLSKEIRREFPRIRLVLRGNAPKRDNLTD